MKFLDVKTDLAFKKVFASEESKDVLISFLNEILYEGREQKVTDLTIVDPYSIPLIKGMKDTFVDVKAVLNDGTKVIIEMQVLNHQGLEKRILYNAAKNYSSQLKKGEGYHLLNPVIALTIVDFVMFQEHPDVISRFQVIEKDSLVKYSDDVELVFVELPKFITQFDDLPKDDIRQQWIYFLQNAGEMEYIPDSFAPSVSKALTLIDESSMSLEELEAQHKRKEFIFIQRSSLTLAKEQGLKQGLEQGLEQGRAEGREEGREQGEANKSRTIARNMQAAGMSVAHIAQLTELSEDQVNALLADNRPT